MAGGRSRNTSARWSADIAPMIDGVQRVRDVGVVDTFQRTCEVRSIHEMDGAKAARRL